MKLSSWPVSLVMLSGSSLLYGTHPLPYSEHHWNFLADAVFMRRAEIDDKPLVKDSNKVRKCPDCTQTLLSTKDIAHFDFVPGYRLSFIYTPDVKRSYEALFLWVKPWHSERSVTGDDSLFFPFNSIPYAYDYVDANHASGKYSTSFWDGEVNYWLHFSPRYTDYFSLSGAIGGRYFHLNESFKLTYEKMFDTSDYVIHTKNKAYGLQVGLDFQMAPTARLSWDFIAKVGTMANRAQQKQILSDMDNTTVLRRHSRHRWQWGLFGDAIVQLGYQVLRHLNLHGGYEFIVLSGLALAPEQVAYGTGTGAGKNPYTHGYIFIHGFYAGLTLGF